MDSMYKINKTLKEAPRNQQLKSNSYYSSKDFGVLIECTVCEKWRKTFQYSELHKVPKNWCCSRLLSENRSCSYPEEKYEETYLDYCPGSIVWAKFSGYPWWPSMVEADPETNEFTLTENDTVHYSVTFLDKKPTRAWVPKRSICHFKKPLEEVKKLKQSEFSKSISKAKKRAKTAMKMELKERLQTYSLLRTHKRSSPGASNFEKCNYEENVCRSEEDSSLLKSPDEPTNDKRNENGISEKERMSEENNLSSKTSDPPNFNKKTPYLINKDFISSEISSYFEEKNHENTTLINKTLRNEKFQILTENKTNREKVARTVTKQLNRRLEKRKLDKSCHNLSPDLIDIVSIDSEHKTCHTAIVTEEVSNTIQNPEENLLGVHETSTEVNNTENKSIRVNNTKSRKRNNMSQPKRLILKISDTRSSKNKPHFTKCSNDKNFTPENKTIFPFLENKKFGHSSSVNKALSNYQAPFECLESLRNPLWALDTTKIIRKGNRKYTPKRTLTTANGDVVDLKKSFLEQKSDHTSNQLILQKEDSEEIVVAKGSENYLLEILSNERLQPEKTRKESYQTQNVSTKKNNSSFNSSSRKRKIKSCEMKRLIVPPEGNNSEQNKLDQISKGPRKKTTK